jgi:serine/threonine-protein kinase HSL1 (negative regulator of Swe1 kinase)
MHPLTLRRANQEKYFYSALRKYHTDQLENYQPSAHHAVAHSNSDHHHNKRHSPTRRDMEELPTNNKHKRSQSAYSILNNEHLYSKHSLYESPVSEASYDPYRASKQPIVPIPEDTPIHQNVTVHRGHSSGNRSDKLRPTTALGHRTGSSLRIQALRNNSKRSSAAMSRDSSNRSTPSHRAVSVQRRSMSRSSLASSHWPSSPPVIVRSSGMGRRGVSFSHLRDRRSSAATASSWQTEVASVADYMSHRPHTSIGSYGPSMRASTIRSNKPNPRAMMSTEAPHLKLGKPESPTKYIQGEARKVSMELGKVMEEAFNRSSVGSSVRSGTGIYHDASQYDSPPTSFSNTRDSGGSTLATTPGAKMLFGGDRPLPPIPSETPNTFLQRKLAETRAEIARRLNEDDDNTEHFNEVLEHLDRLMVPTANGKRTVSAPAKSPEHGPLHAIPEEVRIDGDGFDAYSPNYRAVTDPIRPQARRVVTEQQQTIRIVDGSPTRVAPLNIRKRSGASLKSTAASQAPAVPWPGPIGTTVRPFQDVQNDLHAARTNDAAAPALEKQNTVIKKKKSLWFRRNTEEKDREQENENQIKKKQSNGLLQIPEAWQGLDDRTARRDDPALFAAANVDNTKHNLKHSEISSGSEFPMRNSSSEGAKSDGSRKGFFGGLFGKKTKDDKGKKPMELGTWLYFEYMHQSANSPQVSTLAPHLSCPTTMSGLRVTR